MQIPIIIVHNGNSFYLSPVLRQMRLFNPDSRICLISDSSTKGYEGLVEHHDIDDYMESANEFAKSYVHLSSNPYFYELICFQRWYIILDFVRRHHMEYFLCMDSDVLFYSKVDDIFPNYIDYDFTMCGKGGPGCSLFNPMSLERFCDYMSCLYMPEFIQRLHDFYQPFLDKKQHGGFCDMTVFIWYQDEMYPKVADIAIPQHGECFDGCITSADGFEMDGGVKKVYWKDNRPYGKWLADGSFVKLHCLHFQGRSKYSIYKYTLDANKVHRTDIGYTLSWMFSKGIINARINGLKKAIANPQMFVRVLKSKLKKK